MEFFQYMASVPVIGSMIVFSVVTYRKLFGSSQHILGKQELDRCVNTSLTINYCFWGNLGLTAKQPHRK